MPMQTCTGGMMVCTFGLVPSALIATPKPIVTSSMVAANILDHVPFVNIPPFGMCTCPANPAVAAATTAAFGVLTPMPCVPITPAPWTTGSATVTLANAPALNDTSTLNCIWGGVISFSSPGQATKFIP